MTELTTKTRSPLYEQVAGWLHRHVMVSGQRVVADRGDPPAP